MLLYLTHPAALTKVHVVISSTFAVHLVDKEAGHGFEQQVEDGHCRAEAKHVPSPFCCKVIQRVIDPKMDDVGQYCHSHPHQKLQEKNKRERRLNGHEWRARLLNLVYVSERKVLSCSQVPTHPCNYATGKESLQHIVRGK